MSNVCKFKNRYYLEITMIFVLFCYKKYCLTLIVSVIYCYIRIYSKCIALKQPFIISHKPTNQPGRFCWSVSGLALLRWACLSICGQWWARMATAGMIWFSFTWSLILQQARSELFSWQRKRSMSIMPLEYLAKYGIPSHLPHSRDQSNLQNSPIPGVGVWDK